MSESIERLNAITDRILACAYAVGRELGPGFLEKVYENALTHELQKVGFRAERQKPISVYYDGILVGEYFADLVVEDVIIIELKTVKAIDNNHLAQCLNYLKATRQRLGLLLNFGAQSVQVRRVINGY